VKPTCPDDTIIEYLKGGTCIAAICRELHVSKKRIHRIIRRHGLKWAVSGIFERRVCPLCGYKSLVDKRYVWWKCPKCFLSSPINEWQAIKTEVDTW